LTIDTSEEEDELDDHYRDNWTDTNTRQTQVMYWPYFVTRRRRRRRRRENVNKIKQKA
jgi:hypothetical protein